MQLIICGGNFSFLGSNEDKNKLLKEAAFIPLFDEFLFAEMLKTEEFNYLRTNDAKNKIQNFANWFKDHPNLLNKLLNTELEGIYLKYNISLIILEIDPFDGRIFPLFLSLLQDSTTPDEIRFKGINSWFQKFDELKQTQFLRKYSTRQLSDLVTILRNLNSQYADNQIDNNYFYWIVYRCLNLLPYPQFYQAWHNPLEVSDTTPIGNTSTVQILDLKLLPELLQNDITRDITLRDKVQLVCLDSSQFIDRHNPAVEIYDQMLNLGFSERQNSEPTTLPQLKLDWHSLRRQSDKLLVMVIYNASNQTSELSPQFLDALSKFEGAICVISDNSLTVSLQTFLVNQPDLLGSILGWIKQIILES
jgi:hypothetical protein